MKVMKRKTFALGGAVLMMLFGGIEAASATTWVKHFTGTQDQVRAACKGPGMELLDSPGSTSCINHNNNTGVSCGTDDKCVGSGGPIRMGYFDGVMEFLEPAAAAASPKSLVEPGGASTIPQDPEESDSSSGGGVIIY